MGGGGGGKGGGIVHKHKRMLCMKHQRKRKHSGLEFCKQLLKKETGAQRRTHTQIDR